MARTAAEILRDARTIALVGASPRPTTPSNSVMRYLLDAGYRVIPVRPLVREVHGIPCVPSLTEIDEPIDLVDVFRRPEYCADVARDAVAAGAKALWMQSGVVNEEAAAYAKEHGLIVVMDRCIKVDYASLVGR